VSKENKDIIKADTLIKGIGFVVIYGETKGCSCMKIEYLMNGY